MVREKEFLVPFRNVRIGGRRTSLRFEDEMWDALHEVAARERVSIHDICSVVYHARPQDRSFTSALRVFLLNYFRRAAGEIRAKEQRRDRVTPPPAAQARRR
ncbi:MAG: hypothetical protein GC185_01615 [Alphaproteobacteria bacterium]|nr:hypothetical protein [Alphaproteobacteria bacterium]